MLNARLFRRKREGGDQKGKGGVKILKNQKNDVFAHQFIFEHPLKNF